MDMPVLLQFPGNTYMAITEAALLDYAGMYLIKRNGMLTSQLSPLPNQPNIKVKATFPNQSPWRVLMIGNRIGTLIESNILTSLCPALASSRQRNKIKQPMRRVSIASICSLALLRSARWARRPIRFRSRRLRAIPHRRACFRLNWAHSIRLVGPVR